MPSENDYGIKKRGAVFWLKLAIPRDIRHCYPTSSGKQRTHVEESLHTTDRADANRKKHQRIAVHLDEFARRRNAGVGQRPDDPDLREAYAMGAQARDANEAVTEFEQDRAIEIAEKIERRIGGEAGHSKAQRAYKIAVGRLSLRDALAAQRNEGERRTSTEEKYRQSLGLLLAFMETPDAYPEDVSPDIALRFVDWLNHDATSNRGGPLAFQTKKNLLTGLSSLWGYLEHRREVPRGANPWRDHRVTGKRKPHEAPGANDKRPWTDDEIIKLFRGPELRGSKQAVYTKRLLMEIFALGFFTGCRLDEICSRRVGDMAKIRGGHVFKIPFAKRGSSIRELPILNPIPVAIIARRLKGRTDPNALLFPELSPGGYDDKYAHFIGKAMGNYRRLRAGISSGADTHGTRRTFDTLIEKQGGHPIWAQRYSGHKPIDMTHGVYAKGAASSFMGIAKLAHYPKRIEQAMREALEV